MRKFLFLILLFNCFNFLLLSQTFDPREYDYSHVDSIALNFPKNKYTNISELAKALTKDLKNDNEKFRVIFRWITDNIAYSFSNITIDAEKVFKKKKGVCAGYASLLKALCDTVGIECKLVHGYAKIYPKDIGVKITKSNHDWNIVKIYDKWYLVDVTWASSYSYKGKFIKEFDESYFLSDPNFFIFCHYPEDNKYQLLDKKCQIKEFIQFPIVHASFITPIEMCSGVVTKKLIIKFTSQKSIDKISLKFTNEKYGRPIEIVNKDGIYEINYKFNRLDNGAFSIFINEVYAFGFIKK